MFNKRFNDKNVLKKKGRLSSFKNLIKFKRNNVNTLISI